MNELLTTLTTVFGSACAGLIAWITAAIKTKRKQKAELEAKLKKEEERNEKNKELLNYAMGQIDIVCDRSVKLEPDFKQALEELSKRYHSLDLTTKKGK